MESQIVRLDPVEREKGEWIGRIQTLGIAQFETLSTDDTRYPQHIRYMLFVVPVVVLRLAALDRVGHHHHQMPFHDCVSD